MTDNGNEIDKTCGRFRILSFGGGSPRWVRICADDGDWIHNLKVSDLRDLKYLIETLLRETGQ